MFRHRIGRALLGATLGIALATLLISVSVWVRKGPDGAPRSISGAALAPQAVAGSVTTQEVTRLDATPLIRVAVVDTTGAVINDVHAFLADDLGLAPFAPPDATPIAHTTNGLLEVAASTHSRLVLVSKGYQPATLDAVPGHTYRATLVSCVSCTVRVMRTNGTPLADVTVVLQRKGMLIDLGESDTELRRPHNPASAHIVRMGSTDAMGLATVSDLSPGDYALGCFHETSVLVSVDGVSPTYVTVPRDVIVCTMTEPLIGALQLIGDAAYGMRRVKRNFDPIYVGGIGAMLRRRILRMHDVSAPLLFVELPALPVEAPALTMELWTLEHGLVRASLPLVFASQWSKPTELQLTTLPLCSERPARLKITFVMADGFRCSAAHSGMWRLTNKAIDYRDGADFANASGPWWDTDGCRLVPPHSVTIDPAATYAPWLLKAMTVEPNTVGITEALVAPQAPMRLVRVSGASSGYSPGSLGQLFRAGVGGKLFRLDLDEIWAPVGETRVSVKGTDDLRLCIRVPPAFGSQVASSILVELRRAD